MNSEELPEKIRLQRNSALDSYRKLALTIFSWLFLLNTGGILALVTLISKDPKKCLLPAAEIKVMLLTFALGIFFSLVAVAIDYGVQAFRYKTIEDDCYKFWANDKQNVLSRMSYSKLSNTYIWILIFEGLSVISFLIGLFTGVITLL